MLFRPFFDFSKKKKILFRKKKKSCALHALKEAIHVFYVTRRNICKLKKKIILKFMHIIKYCC